MYVLFYLFIYPFIHSLIYMNTILYTRLMYVDKMVGETCSDPLVHKFHSKCRFNHQLVKKRQKF
jgi:hypothetical protein